MPYAENLPPSNHPDLQTPYPVGEMEDALGRNFYELEHELGAAEATNQVISEIQEGLANGDDAVIWELAGMPERRRTSDLEDQEVHSAIVRGMFNSLPPERQVEVMGVVHDFVSKKKMVNPDDWKR